MAEAKTETTEKTGKKVNTDKLGKALQTVSDIRPGMSLSSLLQAKTIRKRFEDVLDKKAAGFISSILSVYSSNKGLQGVEPMSIISAAAIAASLDLPINPSLGMAHIVPYKGVAQFQIGWKGIYQLAMRSGQYLRINIATVHEGELVKHNPFTGEMTFDEAVRKSESVAGHLLYFKLLNGFEKYFYMTATQMEAHAKRYSKSYQVGDGAWVDNKPAMADKTIAKLGLQKYGPLSIEMEKAFTADQAVIDENGNPNYVDAETVPQSFEELESKKTDEEKK